MIVVGIIALLAALALPGMLRARKRAQASRVKDDLRLIVRADGLYVMASETAAVRSACASFGMRETQPTDSAASGSDAAGQLSCFVGARHIIVCAEGDDACRAHEERHAREGHFHR